MGQIERMEYSIKDLKKIMISNCFFKELKAIYKDSPTFMKAILKKELCMDYYEELFIDVLADVFQHKKNLFKTKEYAKKLESELVKKEKLKLADFNFLLGFYAANQTMIEIPKPLAKRLEKNIEIAENMRSFLFFRNMKENDLQKYVFQKIQELEELEIYLSELLGKHMAEKYGMAGS